MKFVTTFGTLGVAALAIWLFLQAIEFSREVSLPVTLTAVKDLVDR
jgi:hypothetical protein